MATRTRMPRTTANADASNDAPSWFLSSTPAMCTRLPGMVASVVAKKEQVSTAAFPTLTASAYLKRAGYAQ